MQGLPDINTRQFAGRNLHFGVREHGMLAIINGMTLHGGWRVFGATFFVFADYCRPAIRLAALMKLPAIYVFTHDSFYVGEDGPTHEPVEHIASLRAMPGLSIIRPADATETALAWQVAIEQKDKPTALLLTRQALPIYDRTKYGAAENLRKGAYVMWQAKPEARPEILLIATGSEVALALQAADKLAAEGINVRVVNMPSWDLFEKQPKRYQHEVLPPVVKKRLVIEAGCAFGWERWGGDYMETVTLDRFGESGPMKALAQHFGFTPENVVAKAKKMLGKDKAPASTPAMAETAPVNG